MIKNDRVDALGLSSKNNYFAVERVPSLSPCGVWRAFVARAGIARAAASLWGVVKRVASYVRKIFTCCPSVPGASPAGGRAVGRAAERTGERIGGKSEERSGGRAEKRAVERIEGRAGAGAGEKIEESAEEKIGGKTEERIEERAGAGVGEKIEESAEERIGGKTEERTVERIEGRVGAGAVERIEERAGAGTGEKIEERAEERAEEKIEEGAGEKTREKVEESAEERIEGKAEEGAEEKTEEKALHPAFSSTPPPPAASPTPPKHGRRIRQSPISEKTASNLMPGEPLLEYLTRLQQMPESPSRNKILMIVKGKLFQHDVTKSLIDSELWLTIARQVTNKSPLLEAAIAEVQVCQASFPEFQQSFELVVAPVIDHQVLEESLRALEKIPKAFWRFPLIILLGKLLNESEPRLLAKEYFAVWLATAKQLPQGLGLRAFDKLVENGDALLQAEDRHSLILGISAPVHALLRRVAATYAGTAHEVACLFKIRKERKGWRLGAPQGLNMHIYFAMAEHIARQIVMGQETRELETVAWERGVNVGITELVRAKYKWRPHLQNFAYG